uniref:Ig-like domain-containing protein n=1 Tax=Kryptolebias marmoratus TaxID=37003 RepID=A0A3Q3A8T1_KRYMA
MNLLRTVYYFVVKTKNNCLKIRSTKCFLCLSKQMLKLSLQSVRGDKVSVFVYSPLGGDALLPCTTVASPGCSSITWTFFKVGHVHLIEEVSEGHIRDDSDKFNRTSITSNCSLIVRGLIVEDVGSYACLENQKPVMDVYLSLLSIHSTSSVTDLQPGGTLVLTCVLFTFYNAGSCKSYSSVFRLHWLQENGTQLPKDSRFLGRGVKLEQSTYQTMKLKSWTIFNEVILFYFMAATRLFKVAPDVSLLFFACKHLDLRLSHSVCSTVLEPGLMHPHTIREAG